VLGKKLFAVDAPDGEHDFEDVVSLTLYFCLTRADRKQSNM